MSNFNWLKEVARQAEQNLKNSADWRMQPDTIEAFKHKYKIGNRV